MNSIDVYENKEFWQTYNQLYWHNKSNPELVESAKTVSNLLKFDAKEPLYVLVLGLGTGTLELPLLAKIQEHTQRTVRVVAIDKSGIALKIATKQLSAGLDTLPIGTKDILETIEFAAEEKNKDNFWATGNHWLQQDDLDFEPSSNKLFQSFPSDWFHRLKKNMGNNMPNNGFDILISSLCLFHLEWWQRTLLFALSQLRKDGLFLHSQIDGDEHIFEGKVAPKINEDRIKALDVEHSSDTLTRVFDKFFNQQHVRAYSTRPRFASAAAPSGILDALDLFAGHGLDRLPDTRYLISSKCSQETYLSLLETRGFSTFRLIEDAVGSEVYEEILRNIRISEVGTELDTLLFDIVWTIYRVDINKLHKRPIVQKFLGQQQSINDYNDITDYEYEIRESIRNSFSLKARLIVEDGSLAEHLIKKLTVLGLLDSSCLGGDIGFAKDENSRMKYWAFINPHYYQQEPNALNVRETLQNFTSEVFIYLMTLDNNYSLQSLGKSLLKEILPLSQVRLVASYTIELVNKEDAFTGTVELNSYSEFNHLHFNIRLTTDFVNDLNVLAQQLKNKVIENLSDSSMEECRFAFSPQLAEEYKPDLEKLTHKIESIQVDSIRKSLSDSIEKIGGIELILLEKLKEVITDKNSDDIFYKMIWLSIYLPGKYTLAIPVIYARDDKQVADTLFVLVYNSLKSLTKKDQLIAKKISHEIRKLDILYSPYGILRGNEISEKTGISGTLHQLAKDLAITYSKLSKFTGNYKKFTKTHLELEPPLFDLTTLDGIAIGVMFTKCESDKILYELPNDCAEMLKQEWNEENIGEFVNRVIWKQAWRKCISMTQVKAHFESLEIPIDRFKRPSLQIDSPFKLKNANYIYPLVLIVLRNAFEHSWLHSVFCPDKELARVAIYYSCQNESNECIVIENTGERFSLKSQSGTHRDIETFAGLTGKWNVKDFNLKGFPIYSKYMREDSIWRTEIYEM